MVKGSVDLALASAADNNKDTIIVQSMLARFLTTVKVPLSRKLMAHNTTSAGY